MEQELTTATPPTDGNPASYLAGADGKFVPGWHEKAPQGYSVPDGLKTAPDFWSLVKMTENAQRKLGYPADSLLVKPGKDWKEDQWNEFFDKAGRPKDASGYDIQAPKEYQPELVDGFKQVAHKAGLLPNQVKAVFEYYNQLQGKAAEQMAAFETQAREEATRTLKSEWGPNFEANLERAKKYVMTFADDADKAALTSRLGDDPALLRVLANASSVMRDDVLIGTGSEHNAGAGGIEAELNEIMKNPIYFDPDQSRMYKAEHDRLVQRAYRLRGQMR